MGEWWWHCYDPGDFDSSGNQSSGDNFNRRDSYTRHNIDAIATALQTLREQCDAHHWPWKSQMLEWSRGARRYTTK